MPALMRVTSCVQVTLLSGIRQPFTYTMPSSMALQCPLGYRVVVPLGQQLAIGIITEVIPPSKVGVKSILQIPDLHPLCPPTHLNFLSWVSQYYMVPLATLLRRAFSPIKELTQVQLTLHHPPKCLTPPHAKNLLEVLTQGPCSYKEATKYLAAKELFPLIQNLLYEESLSLCLPFQPQEVAWAHASYSTSPSPTSQPKTPSQKKLFTTYRSLTQKLESKWISQSTLLAHGISSQLIGRIKKNPLWQRKKIPYRLNFPKKVAQLPPLTTAQQTLLKSVNPIRWQGKRVGFLYLKHQEEQRSLYHALALDAIQGGPSTLLMVPNLQALSFWEKNLRTTLGDHLMVWSSQIPYATRQAKWYVFQNKKLTFLIATPSLLLSPLPQIDRIIFDQESSPDYKQRASPHYHARDLAIVYAEHHHATVLLTATSPSLITYHNLQKGKYRKLSLPSLPQLSAHPTSLQIITRPSSHPLFTPPLLQKLKEAVQKKSKVIFLHPRRGYTAYTTCPKCDWQARCATCQRALVQHHGSHSLHCHQCRESYPTPSHCPRCQEGQLQYRRIGTQQITERLTLDFPTWTISRIDQDATPQKKAYQAALEYFKKSESHCLVATQKLLPSLPYLKTDLIIWVDPPSWTDQTSFNALNNPYNLLQELLSHPSATQLTLLIPYYQQSTLQELLCHPQTFYQARLEESKESQYPPYIKLVRLILRHKYSPTILQAAQQLIRMLHSYSPMGPSPLPTTPKGESRMEIWVRLTQQSQKGALKRVIKSLLADPIYGKLSITFDVDPL